MVHGRPGHFVVAVDGHEYRHAALGPTNHGSRVGFDAVGIRVDDRGDDALIKQYRVTANVVATGAGRRRQGHGGAGLECAERGARPAATFVGCDVAPTKLKSTVVLMVVGLVAAVPGVNS